MLQRQSPCTASQLTSVNSLLWQPCCVAPDIAQLPCRDGGNHSSLAQLLKDLEKRAEGGAAATEAVGSTISRPLHVVLQVSNVTLRHVQVLQSFVSKVPQSLLLACSCFALLTTCLLLHQVLHAITVFYYIPHD